MQTANADTECVWITGASSGIGLELAKIYARHARYVALSARSADKLAELARAQDALVAHPLDVTDAAAAKDCVDGIVAKAGCPDLAILNAGIWHLMDATELDAGKVRQSVEVNYLGVVNAVAALLPHMLQRGYGHVAIVASVAGYRGLPRACAYGPTKAALINFAETLRCDLAKHGIKISLINPGFVDTPMTRTNPFPMPGLMEAEDAAVRIYEGLHRSNWEISFPRRLSWSLKTMRILPDAVYFWIMKRVMAA